MSHGFISLAGVALLVLLTVNLLQLPAGAAPGDANPLCPLPAVNGGWESGGVYDRHYEPANHEVLAGSLMDFQHVVPLPGMETGLAMVLRVGAGATADGSNDVLVHLGPRSTLEFLTAVLRPGVRLKVGGAFASVGGRQVFMAAKVRLAEVFEVKLRSTQQGTPLWTERASSRPGLLYVERLEQ